MIQLETQTQWSTAEAIDAAEQFFGPGGLGLEVQSRDRRQIYLAGGGGSVGVSASQTAPDKPTVIQIQAREWESAARAFLQQVPAVRGRSVWARLLERFGGGS
ncbi:MAG: hypothetical protein ACK2U9_08225 [Anaerolineae bacterium]